MHPEQPQAPPQANYDFIVNPEKPQKRGLLGGLGNDPFISKIIFLVGGAVVLMVVLALVVNLFFGGRTNLQTIVGLTQSEQEIVRLSVQGKDAIDQQIKNAAINTQLSIKSHQQEWLAFLSKHSRKVVSEELALKKDLATDRRLKTAEQSSTFDPTYTTIMRSHLETYAAAIRTAHKGASNKQEKALLAKQFGDVQLLLKQWPSPDLSLANHKIV